MSRSAQRREATNLSAPRDLVARARELNINMSAVFESALTEAIRRREGEAWLAENRGAIDEYNAEVEKHGLFGDAYRTF